MKMIFNEKYITNKYAATLHLNTVKYAHPDIIKNCVYNTTFQPHRCMKTALKNSNMHNLSNPLISYVMYSIHKEPDMSAEQSRAEQSSLN